MAHLSSQGRQQQWVETIITFTHTHSKWSHGNRKNSQQLGVDSSVSNISSPPSLCSSPRVIIVQPQEYYASLVESAKRSWQRRLQKILHPVFLKKNENNCQDHRTVCTALPFIAVSLMIWIAIRVINWYLPYIDEFLWQLDIRLESRTSNHMWMGCRRCG